jgi:AAA+ superfamily predicted ATPase
LPGHTTLIITAEQVALLGAYMNLARLLQPSMVVIEDVDLIARDREGRELRGAVAQQAAQ